MPARRFKVVLPAPPRIARLAGAEEAGFQAAGGEAWRAGFDAGYRDGTAAARSEGEKLREALEREARARLNALAQIHTALEEAALDHLPQLVLGAVERLLARPVFRDEAIVPEVAALLRELRSARRLVVECPPADLEALREGVAALGLDLGAAEVEWAPKPHLAPGDYLVRSELGLADGRRLVRLRQLQLALDPTPVGGAAGEGRLR